MLPSRGGARPEEQLSTVSNLYMLMRRILGYQRFRYTYIQLASESHRPRKDTLRP
jgi:hypothetical protein